MRICAISFHTCPFSSLGGNGAGGMNVYLKELSSVLSRSPHVRIDIFTRAQSFHHGEIAKPAPNVRVFHLRAGTPSSVDRRLLFDHLPEFTDNLLSFIGRKNESYDVIYTHYWLSGLAGGLLKGYLNVPFVHTYHTLAFLKERVCGETEHMNRKRVEEYLAHASDSIFSTSIEEKRSLIREYGIASRKIEVIYPGVNKKLFYPNPTETLFNETGFSRKNRILLYVGRIEPVKGLMTVVESMAILKNRRNPLADSLRLVVIGGGKKGDELSNNQEVSRIQEAIREKGLGGRIAFLGSRPQGVLKEYYSAADALVVPSLYESFGLVVVESLACGTPVLVSSVGRMKAIVKEGKNGLIFAPGQPPALADCFEEFFLGKKHLWNGSAIRQDITRVFSWEKTGGETYSALLALERMNLRTTRIFQPGGSPRPA